MRNLYCFSKEDDILGMQRYYVVYHKDWVGTFQAEYLKNVIIDWYEITNVQK